MHLRRLLLSSLIIRSPSNTHFQRHLSSSTSVNDICRLLSDFRYPHHDLESALTSSLPPTAISTDVVEQVLKRCKGLAVSAHLFFLWLPKTYPDFRHSHTSYRILIDVLGRARHFPLVWDLLYQLRDGGEQVKRELFWLLFRCYCRAKLAGDAVRAFRRMEDFGIAPGAEDVHQLLINLCGNRLMDDAVDVFRKCGSVSAKSYCLLMKGWVDSGKPDEAVKLFDEMRGKCELDVIAYNTYVGSLCKLGEFGRAHEVLREMKGRGFEAEASTYAVLLRAYCDVNDMGSADRVLHHMRRCKLVPNVFTYNCVVKLLCRNRKADRAYEILDEMVESGLKPDIWSYNTVLAVHCELREVNKALRLLGRMHRGGPPPDLHTYNMLLKMLIEVGRVDRAVEVWAGMGDRGFHPSSSTYAVMIHGLAKKKGKMEEACKYFEMMVDDGIPPYLNTCEMMRDRLLRLGLSDNLHVLGGKMRRSTSMPIQELSQVMVDDNRRRRGGEGRQ